MLACLASELSAIAAHNPQWTVAHYEDLVEAPKRAFPELAEELQIAWTEGASAAVSGPLAPLPRTRGIDPRLTESEAKEIADVLKEFDLPGWTHRPKNRATQIVCGWPGDRR
jgi:hypothetical protein